MMETSSSGAVVIEQRRPFFRASFNTLIPPIGKMTERCLGRWLLRDASGTSLGSVMNDDFSLDNGTRPRSLV
jgi:hypothetical protein